MGFAHSVETWLDGELVGGLYGVAIRAAFLESYVLDKDRCFKSCFSTLDGKTVPWWLPFS